MSAANIARTIGMWFMSGWSYYQKCLGKQETACAKAVVEELLSLKLNIATKRVEDNIKMSIKHLDVVAEGASIVDQLHLQQSPQTKFV